MTDYNRVDPSNLNAFLANGTPVLANRDGAPSTFGLTLAAGTYYVPFGAPKSPTPAETPLVALQVRATAALAATFTVEDCLWPSTRSPGDGRGDPDVTDFDATAGNWIQENPASATVSTSGTGWTPTAATVVAAGSTIGGALWHLGNNGSRRWRLKIVVTTGGLCRVGVHGKAAG
jgi:hypothetical protein